MATVEEGYWVVPMSLPRGGERKRGVERMAGASILFRIGSVFEEAMRNSYFAFEDACRGLSEIFGTMLRPLTLRVPFVSSGYPSRAIANVLDKWGVAYIEVPVVAMVFFTYEPNGRVKGIHEGYVDLDIRIAVEGERSGMGYDWDVSPQSCVGGELRIDVEWNVSNFSRTSILDLVSYYDYDAMLQELVAKYKKQGYLRVYTLNDFPVDIATYLASVDARYAALVALLRFLAEDPSAPEKIADAVVERIERDFRAKLCMRAEELAALVKNLRNMVVVLAGGEDRLRALFREERREELHADIARRSYVLRVLESMLLRIAETLFATLGAYKAGLREEYKVLASKAAHECEWLRSYLQSEMTGYGRVLGDEKSLFDEVAFSLYDLVTDIWLYGEVEEALIKEALDAIEDIRKEWVFQKRVTEGRRLPSLLEKSPAEFFAEKRGGADAVEYAIMVAIYLALLFKTYIEFEEEEEWSMDMGA